MSIASIVTTPSPTPVGPSGATPATVAPTANAADAGSNSTVTDPSGKHDGEAVKVTLSSAASAALDPNKKINSDGTIGPHHKARHPTLPGSFHV